METIRDPSELQRRAAAWRQAGRGVGLVPTMGALHEGHRSLILAARGENDGVIVSLFVNPTQFGPAEDFTAYPRDEAADARLAAAAGADLLFAPAAAAMYPAGFQTAVRAGPLARPLCGAFRPGHFDGVLTVVLKLFLAARPHRAYFGLKDYQQCLVVEQMTRDLGLDLAIRRCPTVREADGLALSSRNRYLAPAERRQALALYRALDRGRRAIGGGETRAARVRALMRAELLAAPAVRADYLGVFDPATLAPLAAIGERALLAGAIRVGATRLIDNLLLAGGEETAAGKTA